MTTRQWVMSLVGILLVASLAGCSEQSDPLVPRADLKFALVSSGVSSNLNAVSFASPNIGIAVGDDGVVLRTTDGGVNWSRIDGIAPGRLLDVAFVSANVGYVVGASDLVLETRDAGMTWKRITPTGSPDPVTVDNISFWSTDRGVVTASISLNNADRGLAFRLVGGVLENSSPVFDRGFRSSVALNDSQMVAICTCRESSPCGSTIGVVTYSTGAITTLDSSGYDDFDAIASNPGRGWMAVGGNGSIRGSNQLATGWKSIASGTTLYLADIHFAGGGEGFIVGDSGTFLSSSDFLGQWIVHAPATREFLAAVCPNTENSGIAVGRNGTIVRFFR